MNKKALIIAGVVVAVLLVAGAANRYLGKSAAENALEDIVGGDVDVDANGNQITVTTDEGTWSTSDKLPTDFPTDVPVYPGSKVQASVAASQVQGGSYVALETADSMDTIVNWYKAEVAAKGWTVSMDLAVEGGLMIGASKDTRDLVVTISREDGKSVIGLMVTKK